MNKKFKVINKAATGNNIKRLMKENNISVKMLAEKLNITEQGVYKFLNGKTYPSLDNLFFISQLFDKEINEIIISE